MIRLLYISVSIPAFNQVFPVQVVYFRYGSCFEKAFVALSIFTELVSCYCVFEAVASPVEVFVGAHVEWIIGSLMKGFSR
jgi:hypothetical protein